MRTAFTHVLASWWHRHRGGAASSSRGTVLLLGVLFTALCVCLSVIRPHAVRDLEGLAYDAMVRQLPREAGPSQVVIVEIDEKSLQRLGQWPWPRYRIAQLLDVLRESGVFGVGLDFLFAEPDRTSLANVQTLYREERGLEVSLGHLDPAALDNDLVLAKSMASMPTVLGVYMGEAGTGATMAPAGPAPAPVFVRRTQDAPELPPLPEAGEVVLPVPVLANAAARLGFFNSQPDQDGKTRRAPLLVRAQGATYPSLALATVLLGQTNPQLTVRLSAAGVEQVDAGELTLATDGAGAVLLPYRPGAFDQFVKLSAVELLEGARADLRGKYVLVGATVNGLGDIHPTPLSRATPGIYVHALLADALLKGHSHLTPAWEPGLQVALCAVLGLSVTLLLAFLPMSVGALLSLFLLGGTVCASFLLLRTYGLAITPVVPALTLVLALTFLELLRSRMGERYVLDQIRELVASQECALRGFASVAETRDPETGAHIIRTQYFVEVLAQRLATHPDFQRELTQEHIALIVKSAPLHDIGKVSVPDRVLLKAGKLTGEEFEIMKQHAITGYEVLRRARTACDPGAQLSFLHYAEEMALTHHEKWDGSGYPHGRSGDGIPIAGRLMALADVYDALRSKRVYKPAFSHKQARELIVEGWGKHFDPRIVDAFLETEQEFQEIWELHPDVLESAQCDAPSPAATSQQQAPRPQSTA